MKEQKKILRTALASAAMVCIMTVSAFAAESGVISADVVNARKGPGTNYDRVELLAKGKAVSVLGEENGWYKIKWNNSTGYVVKDYVALSSASTAEANATVTGGSNVNVRSGAGTGYNRIAQLGTGKRVTVLDKSGDWYHISFDGRTGYISASYLIPDGASAPAVPDTSVGNATVKGGSSINVRTGPGTGYNRVASVGTGKRVTLLAEEGGWFKVEFDGKSGYILGNYIAPDAGVLDTLVSEESDIPASVAESSMVEAGGTGDVPAGEGSRSGIITGGTINVRTGPGTEYERVTKVTTGKKVTILGEENGWFQIAMGEVVGYVRADFLYEGDSLPASSVGEQVVALARQYLGTRYVYGGSSPSGFDCSGFAMYLYKQFGYSLPHTASGQYANCGVKIAKSDLQPGDLVFFTSPGNGGRINHVGVYMGGGDVIHARYSLGRVHINNLSESYYAKHYVGAVRIA
ncbi:MAG: SH3 domain-containing protein [Oscillospiraceae bacterium]|nr:SH3 domain-containing protein [Oscillospiraceae bacterium]